MRSYDKILDQLLTNVEGDDMKEVAKKLAAEMSLKT